MRLTHTGCGAWARRLSVLTLAGGCLAACSPTMDWREVKPAQADGLRALFPCQPDLTERTVRLPSVPQAVVMRVLSCQAGEATWALSQVTVPEASQVGPTLVGLARIMQDNLAAASQMAGSQEAVRVTSLGTVKVPGMTPQPDSQGWRYEARRVDGWGRPLNMAVTAWHFSHGLSVFQASVSSPVDTNGHRSAQDAEQSFLSEFRFPA